MHSPRLFLYIFRFHDFPDRRSAGEKGGKDSGNWKINNDEMLTYSGWV
jgi:hypothetical protein